METTLNQLLNEMDGFEENDRIIVVAATNLASSLDPALQRPGRFDHKIEVTLPNLEDRKEIVKIHLKNVSIKIIYPLYQKSNQVNEEDVQKVAQLTEGMSGAEIENIVNLAALQSVRKSVQTKQKNSKLEGKDLIEFATKQLESQKSQIRAA